MTYWRFGSNIFGRKKLIAILQVPFYRFRMYFPSSKFGQTGLAIATAIAPLAVSAEELDVMTLVAEGAEMVPSCVSCHGDDGLGNADIGAPMLAGMNAGYLTEALKAYANGTRSGYTMTAFASELSPQQMIALGEYYAGLPAAPKQWDIDKEAAVEGALVAQEGVWAENVPACTSCHGVNGEGLSSAFPRIAGQLPIYMIDRIAFWREGEDKADSATEGLMANVARNTPPEAMEAAIYYFAGLSPNMGPKTTYDPLDIEWPILSYNTVPLPDEILFEKAEAAYDRQQRLIEGPENYLHTPPALDEIPAGPEGELIRLGRKLFTDTQMLRGTFVGNDQECADCHMGAGADALSAPVWATAVDFPQFRGKNQRVNTLPERIAGCFTYSMDGTPPPAQHKVMVALETYMKWLGRDIPSDTRQEVRGYFYLPLPEEEPDYPRGASVYAERCSVCHGDDGRGLKVGDRVVYPPLWGPQAYNWGAGMHTLDKAAGFVKHNMPLGNPDLTDQEVWDVVLYLNSHERPQDPRWRGGVAETRAAHHDHTCTYGLETPNGLMGATGEPLPKPDPQPWSEWSSTWEPKPTAE